MGRWCRTHPEALLTGAVLPLGLWLTGADGGRHHEASTLALSAAAWLALLARRRRPLGVLATVAALDLVRALVAGESEPISGTLPLASMLALYTVGSQRRPAVAFRSAAAVAVAQYAAVVIAFDRPTLSLLYFNWALVGVAIGALMRERHQRVLAAEQRAEDAEASKAEEARRQVLAERVRIARELHDSLAHHITVVNAQAGVAQYLMDANPDAAKAALTGIAENSRSALDELRATLGLLRDEQTGSDGLSDRVPVPGFDQLTALIDTFRSVGVAISLEQSGEPRPLTGVTDLAAYRIVQEALSNAARHAPGATIEIAVGWSERQLSLTIANSAPTTTGELAHHGTGHGMIGMQERATAAGGTLTAGPAASDGYRVCADLPLPEQTPNGPPLDAPPPGSGQMQADS